MPVRTSEGGQIWRVLDYRGVRFYMFCVLSQSESLLTSDLSLSFQEGAPLVKKIKAVFLFEVTDSSNKKHKFLVDLKNGTGCVKRGKEGWFHFLRKYIRTYVTATLLACLSSDFPTSTIPVNTTGN